MNNKQSKLRFKLSTYNSCSGVSEREQNLMSVRVERKENVEFGVVLDQVVLHHTCFGFREWTGSSIGVTASRSRSSFIAILVGNEPIVSKVSVGINAVADERAWRSCLAPVSVGSFCVFETVRVCNQDNVPVNILS